jgi:hypothetical protein
MLIGYMLVLAIAVVISLKFIFWSAVFLFLFIKFLLQLGTLLECLPHGDDVAKYKAVLRKGYSFIAPVSICWVWCADEDFKL